MKLGIYESKTKDYFFYFSRDVSKTKVYYLTDLQNSLTWEFKESQKEMSKKLKKWKWKYAGEYKMEIK